MVLFSFGTFKFNNFIFNFATVITGDEAFKF